MRPTTRRLSVLATAVVLAALAPAAADTGARNDRNDSPGLLDMKRVIHRHAGDGILVHRFRTFDAWDWSIFEEGSRVYFSFFVEAGSTEDRTLQVTASSDGTPYAEMTDADGGTLGYARVWKPSPRSLQVEFPKRLLGKKVSEYRWKVRTIFHQTDHPDCGTSGDVRVLCNDRAPNKRKIRHRLS